MKNSRLIVIIFIVIIASVLSSTITLKLLFPRLLSQYGIWLTETFQENTAPVVLSGATLSLKQVESGVKSIATSLRTSVVNIIINQDVQLYRSDPFGFFYEPSGTVRKKVWGWSGFFITKDGLILTNKHVVSEQNATYTIITGENEEYTGKVVAVDPLSDLAILRAVTKDGKVISDRKPVTFVHDAKMVEVGSFVIAMGNALAEFQNTLTFGIISGLGRTIEAGNGANGDTEQLSGLLQTDAAINPGNSGGPLVNLDGQVIGINTAVAAWANGLGFAIPLSQKEVDFLLASLKKFNAIKRPFLGIKYISLDKNIAAANHVSVESGDMIAPDGIVAGSPAEKVWLQSGDVILMADGIPLKNGKSLRDALVGKMPGEKVNLQVLKNQEKITKTIEVTLGSI